MERGIWDVEIPSRHSVMAEKHGLEGERARAKAKHRARARVAEKAKPMGLV